MKAFREWKNKSDISEGVSPTDIDSANKDQNLSTVGDFHSDSPMKDADKSQKEFDKIDREFADKLKKAAEDDEKDEKPSTEGGIVSKSFKKFFDDYDKRRQDWAEKDEKTRKAIPAKNFPDTFFIHDKYHQFTPSQVKDGES